MIIRLVSYNCGWIRRAEHAPSSLGLLVPHQLTLARCGLRTAGITVQTEAKLAVCVDFLTGKVWQSHDHRHFSCLQNKLLKSQNISELTPIWCCVIYILIVCSK